MMARDLIEVKKAGSVVGRRQGESGSVPSSVDDDAEYTDEQFDADLVKSRKKLEILAEKARQSVKAGTARKFPA